MNTSLKIVHELRAAKKLSALLVIVDKLANGLK